MHRALTARSLLTALLLTACPGKEEPVLIEKGSAAKGAPARAEPAKAEPAKAEPAKVELEQADSVVGEAAVAPGNPPTTDPSGEDPAPPAAPNEGNDAPAPVKQPAPASPPESKPKPVDAPAKVDGRGVFMKRCKTCHGADGKADTKMGHKHDIPDMTGAEWDRKWPADKVVRIVTEGKSGTKMKAFQEKLTPEEIEAVSAFVRQL